MDYPYQGQKIVLFDGACVLCNRSVDFLLKTDRKNRLKFASLQSNIAASILKPIKYQPLTENTIIFIDEGRLFLKSTAVLRIAGYLGFPYSAIAIFRIIPRPLRDGIYDFIARNRVKWFGTRVKCRVPDEKTAGRIIG